MNEPKGIHKVKLGRVFRLTTDIRCRLDKFRFRKEMDSAVDKWNKLIKHVVNANISEGCSGGSTDYYYPMWMEVGEYSLPCVC